MSKKLLISANKIITDESGYLLTHAFVDEQIPTIDSGTWLWASQAVQPSDSTSMGYDVVIAPSGNCYATGNIQNTATFGDTTLTGVGSRMFIAKLDSLGNWLWATQPDNIGSIYGYGITIDSLENCYVSGTFAGTAIFGSTTLTGINSDTNTFVAKLDSSGNWLWAIQGIQISGTTSFVGWNIAADSSGFCITGSFSGVITFGATTLTNANSDAAFVAKFDSLGNWLWAKQAHKISGAGDMALSIAADSSGNYYITGTFQDITAFGSTFLTSTGEQDIYIAKLDASGNWLWAIQAGGTLTDQGIDIVADSSGNCFVTGLFRGTATFDAINITSTGSANSDIFIAKLNSSGEWLWATKAGNTGLDQGLGIVADSSGDCYVTGVFSNTVAFGDTVLVGGVQTEIFCAKLGASGNWLWAIKAGGLADACFGIDIDSLNNCYVTGSFRGTASFGDTTLIGDAAKSSAFVAKFKG